MEIRTGFHKRLREIQDDVLVMGSMATKAIQRSIEALKTRDLDLARQIIADDQLINHRRFGIEEKCIEIIATQQPMASDLRIILAVLNIIIEVERIGDYAEGIAKITIMIGDEPPLKPLIDIPRYGGTDGPHAAWQSGCVREPGCRGSQENQRRG